MDGRTDGRRTRRRRTSKENRLFNNPFSGTPSPQFRVPRPTATDCICARATRTVFSRAVLSCEIDFCRERRGEEREGRGQKRKGSVRWCQGATPRRSRGSRMSYPIKLETMYCSQPEDGHRRWHLTL